MPAYAAGGPLILAVFRNLDLSFILVHLTDLGANRGLGFCTCGVFLWLICWLLAGLLARVT